MELEGTDGDARTCEVKQHGRKAEDVTREPSRAENGAGEDCARGAISCRLGREGQRELKIGVARECN